MQVRLFRTTDGAPVEGNNVVPVSEVSWKLGYNEADDIELKMPASRELLRFGARQKMRPWRTLAAVVDDGGYVIAAGPILRRKWTPDELTVKVGGGWSLFEKRLVLNRALRTGWVDGELLVDEDNPAGPFVLQFAGMTLGGIGAGLVREALQWGPLAVDSPVSEAGTQVRTYYGWDFATVSERLEDLSKVIGGPFIRFEPYLRSDGFLRFRYVADQGGEVVHTVATGMEQAGGVIDDIDEDGDNMATQAYMVGGKEDDVALVARSSSPVLVDEGWPVMQVADTSHSTVSQMSTLVGYGEQIVADGSSNPESTRLKLRRSRQVRPGDVLEVFTDNSYHGRINALQLDVAAVSGDLTEWVSVTAFPRGF